MFYSSAAYHPRTSLFALSISIPFKMRCSLTCCSFWPCGYPGCPYSSEVIVASDNYAHRDYDMDISDNIIRPGRGGIKLGVENTAGRDNNMAILRNKVDGGRYGANVRMGVDNDACYDNRMKVFGNTVKNATDDVDIAVGNRAGRHNAMQVYDNEVHGGNGRVRIGSGNTTRSDNNGRISGNKIYR